MEIWKFDLVPFADQTIDMPSSCRPISAAFQQGNIRVWAVVVPSNALRKHRFIVVATGQPSDETVGTFLGTVHTPDGFVFHVFDRGEV